MIVLLVIQLIKSNFIQPLVMSRTMKLHPVSVIVSILFFGYFFGIIGMIVATPIIAISKMLLLFLNKKYNIIKV
jgi:predicted PurR-regulated permease PerM